MEVSFELKSVHDSLVICAEVLGRMTFPVVFCSDRRNETRSNVVNVDSAISYELSKFDVIKFIPPCHLFGSSDASWHIV